jgi:hypothetical protein
MTEKYLDPPLSQYVGQTVDAIWPRQPRGWEYAATILSADEDTKLFEVVSASGDKQLIEAFVSNFAFYLVE